MELCGAHRDGVEFGDAEITPHSTNLIHTVELFIVALKWHFERKNCITRLSSLVTLFNARWIHTLCLRILIPGDRYLR